MYAVLYMYMFFLFYGHANTTCMYVGMAELHDTFHGGGGMFVCLLCKKICHRAALYDSSGLWLTATTAAASLSFAGGWCWTRP